MYMHACVCVWGGGGMWGGGVVGCVWLVWNTTVTGLDGQL